jgi:hypothetical protein
MQPDLGPANLVDLTTFRGYLVAVGNAATDPEPGVIWSSTDGVTWRSIAGEAPLAGAYLEAVAAGDPGLVTVGSNELGRAIALLSPDGVSWSSPRLPGASAFSATSVAWGLGRYVAVGSGIGEHPSTPTIAWLSVDGRAWTRATIDGVSHAALFGLAAGPRGFVAAGSLRDRAAAWVSADGRVWRPVALPGGPSGVEGGRVRYVGGRFLLSVSAFGPDVDASHGVVWSSSDGRHWTRSIAPGSGAAVFDFAAIPGGGVSVGRAEEGDQPGVVTMADANFTSWTLQPADPVFDHALALAILQSPDGRRLVGVGNTESGAAILLHDLPFVPRP